MRSWSRSKRHAAAGNHSLPDPRGEALVTEKPVAVVCVHGVFSSESVWERFQQLVATDGDLSDAEILCFPYSSPLLSVNPLRRIPDIDDVSDTLTSFLKLKASAYDTVMLVGHSQGGLIIQRYLARTLEIEGFAGLSQIGQVVLFACPNNGSDFGRLVRTLSLYRWRHHQVAELGPLNRKVTEAQSIVLNKLIHGPKPEDSPLRLHVQVYAGDADGIVPPASARSVFPNALTLPGDHSSIVRPSTRSDLSYLALRRHILLALGHGSGRAREGGEPENLCETFSLTTRRCPRETLQNQLTTILAGRPQLVVISGLPRTGKTTAACDAVDSLSGVASSLAWQAHLIDARSSHQLLERVSKSASPRIVVLDDVSEGSESERVAAALAGLPATTVLITSRTQLDGLAEMGARSVQVQPLSESEIRIFASSGWPEVDLDDVLQWLPEWKVSLPGALIAFLNAASRRPARLIKGAPAPMAAANDYRQIDELIAELSREERTLLAELVASSALTPIGELAPAGDCEALFRRCLLSYRGNRIDVPRIVAARLSETDLRDAVKHVCHRLALTFARSPSARLAIAGAICALIADWRSLSLFPTPGSTAFASLERLNIMLNDEGYWDEYIYVSGDLASSYRDHQDRDGAVRTLCRLARKVGQQGDMRKTSDILREAADMVDETARNQRSAELFSTRAFLAYLQDDIAFAQDQLRRCTEAQLVMNDRIGLGISLKMIGDTHLKQREYAQAKTSYLAALQHRSFMHQRLCYETEISLALCHYRLGKRDEALALLEPVIDGMRFSGDRTELPRALYIRALIAEKQGYAASALDLIREGQSGSTKDPAVRAGIDRMAWRLERFGKVPKKLEGPE